ncbi:MAG TPA: type II toxin-antitoxin system RatA family toxin [Burkholderiaceae bacterium]|jgi:ribosome-associated toxin RatA of RatAB toxin-antitoxin module|nr:type II toxin-antitoxin system RatA family toxin [Burkholderiaceae bacterium]
MTQVDRSLLVHYSAEQMFDLVADVESYPRFLPWCSGAKVHRHHEGGVDASVALDYRGIRAQFTTHNDLRYPEQIRMSLREGPFRSLGGHWSFIALRPGACKVHLVLHYEIASSLLGRALAPVFEHVIGSMIESFEARAEALYGPT